MSKHAVMPLADYVNVCNALREKIGTTEPIKSGDIPKKVNDIYDMGKLATLKDSRYMNGKESGAIVSVNDVTPIEHNVGVKLSSDTITDFTGVEVTKCGANLIDGLLRSNSIIASGINIQYLPDEDCYLLNGTCTYTVDAYVISHNFLVNDYITTTIITVSGSVALNGGYAVFYSGYKDSVDGTTYNWSGPDISYSHSVTSSSPRLYLSTTKFYIEKGVVFEDYKVKIQVAKGKNAAEYEPFTKETYTANADGTVEGVKSISPNMTLIPNNNAVTVECEYLRDIDLYIDNLITNVALTGGV